MTDLQKTLIDKINKAAQLIHEKQLKNEGNYMVVSPKIAKIIENLDIKKHRMKKLKKLKEIFENKSE